MCDGITDPLQTSTIALLKLENGYVVKSHTYLGMWLRNHVEI